MRQSRRGWQRATCLAQSCLVPCPWARLDPSTSALTVNHELLGPASPAAAALAAARAAWPGLVRAPGGAGHAQRLEFVRLEAAQAPWVGRHLSIDLLHAGMGDGPAGEGSGSSVGVHQSCSQRQLKCDPASPFLRSVFLPLPCSGRPRILPAGSPGPAAAGQTRPTRARAPRAALVQRCVGGGRVRGPTGAGKRAREMRGEEVKGGEIRRHAPLCFAGWAVSVISRTSIRALKYARLAAAQCERGGRRAWDGEATEG